MNPEKIVQAIVSYDTIIIHRHVRPDPDAFGSQAGLKEIIKASYPEKNVYMAGKDEASLDFLTKMDVIDDDTYKGALVIVCDTANQERIDDGRYHTGDKLIKIDHHPNMDKYGDELWVDTTASSTSELIYGLYMYANEEGYGLKMTDDAARLLYAGIVGDTGRFLFPSTTKKTMQYAADLIEYPFDRAGLYNHLYDIPANIARLKGYILQNFELTSSGMCSVKLTKGLLNQFNLHVNDTGQVVGVLGDMQGIKAWVMFIEEDNLIRVRLRSKGPVINTIAAKYDGGGHPMASGAKVSTWEEAGKVEKDLEEACAAYSN